MEYWYLWLIFAALVIITAVVIVFAGKAVSARNEQTKEIMAQLDRLKALKDKYTDLTVEKVENADPEELLEGVCTVLQVKIDKSDDPDAEFARFNEDQKTIYVLHCFISEYNSELSSFFSDYTSDFSGHLVVAAFLVPEYHPFISTEFGLYSDSGCGAPFDKELKDKTDAEFDKIYSKEKFLEAAKTFIKDNIDSF
mgnify:FL=1